MTKLLYMYGNGKHPSKKQMRKLQRRTEKESKKLKKSLARHGYAGTHVTADDAALYGNVMRSAIVDEMTVPNPLFEMIPFQPSGAEVWAQLVALHYGLPTEGMKYRDEWGAMEGRAPFGRFRISLYALDRKPPDYLSRLEAICARKPPRAATIGDTVTGLQGDDR